MIEKRIPRKLNKASDSKTLPGEDMRDAINISIGEDAEGNAGVIKPVKSNQENTNFVGEYPNKFFDSLLLSSGDASMVPFFGDRYVLGKCIDDKNNVVYYFVCDNSVDQDQVSAEALEANGDTLAFGTTDALSRYHRINSGVYAYDPDNYLPVDHAPEEIIPVFWTAANGNGINFLNDPLSFVKADITYVQKNFTIDEIQGPNPQNLPRQRSYSEVPMLFFTDGNGEPYKLNVFRALEYCNSSDNFNTAPAQGPSGLNTTNFPQTFNEGAEWTKDFLYVCTKTPVVPIVGEWFNDETANSNEFIGVNGCQFAYQVVYRDGNESAISTYSDVYVPPGYLAYNGVSDIDMLNQQNAIRLTIPTGEFSNEAEKVKILVRKGETGSWFVVETIPSTQGTVEYTNTSINAAISNDVQSKQFDNVPLSAQTQTIIDNRLVYGNYEEGWNDVEADADISVFSVQRGDDFKTFQIEVGPATCPSPFVEARDIPNSSTYTGAINKNAGFYLDLSPVEGSFLEGDYITFSYTLKPKQNWHVYNATMGYHASPQLGDDFRTPATGGNKFYNIGEDPDAPGTQPPGYWWMNEDMSGISTGMTYACTKNGVTGVFIDETGEVSIPNRYSWMSLVNDGGTAVGTEGNSRATDFGTSAGNPLIIKGGAINVKCSFALKVDRTKDEVVDYIARLIDGERPGDLQNLADLENFIENVDATDLNDVSYTFNLGLSEGSTFSETSETAKLICMATNNPYDTNIDGTSGGGDEGARENSGAKTINTYLSDVAENFSPIDGFFLVNKATVEMGVFRDTTYNETYTVGGVTFAESKGLPRERFGLYIKSIKLEEDNESILSCLRRPWIGSKWWCFSAWKNIGNRTTSTQDSAIQFWGWNPEVNDISTIVKNYTSNGFPVTNNVGNPVLFYSNGNPNWTDMTTPSVKRVDGYIQNLYAENNLYNENTDYGGFTAPWARSVGGMRLRAIAFDTVGSITSFYNGERYSAHHGKKVSCYSLVDGDGGPGGRGEGVPDSDKTALKAYRNFALPRHKGDIPGQTDENLVPIDHYLYGVQNLGSAAIIGFRGDNPFSSLTESVINYGYTRLGVFGPAIDNRTNIGDAVGGTANLVNAEASFRLSWFRHGYRDPSTGEMRFSSRFGVLNQGGTGYTWNWWTPSIGHPQNGQQEDHNEVEAVTIFPTQYMYYVYNSSFTSTIAASALADSWTDLGFFPGLNLPPGSVTSSVPETINTTFYIVDIESQGARTFKAGATHSFGVIYYDERGRASDVYPVGGVYSPWYSERTDGNYGPNRVKIKLNHAAPERAKHFQIAYSGNTTASRFVQYSTGGAFVLPGSADEGLDGNIYVSLNYLQGHPISFAKSYGARSVEGAQDIYTFREGDRLRIISYFTGDEIESRIYPTEVYEFNIVDQVTLSKGSDNPLYDENLDTDTPHPAKTGSFIVLENNQTANGFSYFDVLDGGNDPNADSHYWNKRCVVEIYSPKLAGDEESLVYYETSNVYPISEHNDEKTLSNGDAWFRRMPVNMAIWDEGFKSLIGESNENDASSPNLLPYFLESQVFSEKVRNSDVNGKGKFKIVNPDASQIIRKASLTYSDKNNPASKILSLTSFNPSKGQFKDLPSEFGDINYTLNNDDSIFCIQSNRCSSIPVNRNLITDLGNTQSLVAAKEVLGTEGYYAGNYGCDDNPESVCQIGNTVYFASKSNRQVYKFNPSNGIQVISDIGMKSFFKKLFETAEKDRDAGEGDIRVVGGYDPYKDNYILSVYNINVANPTPADVEDETDTGGGGDPGTGGLPVIKSIEFPQSAVDALVTIMKNQGLSFERSGDLNDDASVTTNDLLTLLSTFGMSGIVPEGVTVFEEDNQGPFEENNTTTSFSVDSLESPTKVYLDENAAFKLYSQKQGETYRADINKDGEASVADILGFLAQFGAVYTNAFGQFVIELDIEANGINIEYEQ